MVLMAEAVSFPVPPLFQKQGNANAAFEIQYREEDWDGEVTEHRQVVVNSPASLYCDTNAIPPPTLTWSKDGEPLSTVEGAMMLLGNELVLLTRLQ